MTEQSTVLGEVLAELARQVQVWGVQNHPDGTGSPGKQREADRLRADCDQALETGSVTWSHILAEEVAEAFAEADPERIRAELIQVAGVAVQWIEAIDRRRHTEVGDAEHG